ncbi:bile acid:sodium symporter family protein [Nitrincola sp.]|uniref:bile acid:sodium symporter family protein n=1 Tax=Nitrincola sp. TaxID=1926584 RepID=UPI003A93D4E8
MQATLVSQIFLPLALFVIMLSVGMSLKLSDFVRVARQPVPVFLGILTQLLMLPLLGWIVVQLFNLPPLLAAGLMILTFAPGGATSNAITLLARGDAALSVSLTAINSLIIPFTLPLLTALILTWLSLESTLVRFPVIQAIGQMVLITLLPVVLGMLFGQYCPNLNHKLRSLFRSLALILMLMTVILLVVSSWDRLIVLLPQLALPVLILVLAAMSLGYILARMLGLDEPQQITLLVEVGLQNAGTALLVTSTLLQSPEMSASALVYGVLMQLPAMLLIVWRNRAWLFGVLKQLAVSS